MNTIEEKILKILNEEIPYEVIGGPTPSATLQQPLDYAKPITQAHVPQATPIPGVGEIDGDAQLREDEDDSSEDDKDKDDDKKDDLKECDKDDDKDDDKKDALEETFAMLLRRLVEEDEDDKKDDKKDDDKDDDKDLKEDEPKETLPTVDSLVDEPGKLVTPAPGVAMAEGDKKDEDDDDSDKKELDEDEPKIILPDVDSLVDDPSKLLNQAPGAAVIEDEAKKKDDDKDDDDKDDKKKDFDFAEDMRAIFSGAKLSEAVKAKVATIFKAAVVRRVNEERHVIAKKATGKLTEAFTTLKTAYSEKQKTFETKLSGNVDSYLNYVVENWMKENRLAVERGIRAELAENFIVGLKKLFVENYIEVPQSKVDVVATLGNKVTKLEKKLNEALENNISMRSSLNTYRKDEVVRSVGAGLTDTQADKLSKLAEGVEYTTRKEFAAKLQSLKESYFPKVAAPKKEEPLMEAKKPELSDEMALYSNAISKSKK